MNAIIIDYLTSTSLNGWILDSVWAWPIFEIIHFFGLSILMGALLVIDLRLIGFFKAMSLTATEKIVPLVYLGFSLNLITGVLFFVGDPGRYIINTGFLIKMILVVLACINALYFTFKISPQLAEWEQLSSTPITGKIVGYLSLIFWFGVLALGRLIPYVSTG
jgi:hypothetical protein